MMVLREYDVEHVDILRVKDIHFERQAVAELMRTLSNNDYVYAKLKHDYLDLSRRYSEWFEAFCAKSSAQPEPGCFWDVDFARDKVLLRRMPPRGGGEAPEGRAGMETSAAEQRDDGPAQP